jgi:hypothetical protein
LLLYIISYATKIKTIVEGADPGVKKAYTIDFIDQISSMKLQTRTLLNFVLEKLAFIWIKNAARNSVDPRKNEISKSNKISLKD